MICEKCQSENREGSNFCRSCGSSLKNTSLGKIKNISLAWNSPTVLILLVVIIGGILFWGGSKAYAYFQIQSKLGSAKTMQLNKNYSGSLKTLASLNGFSLTIAETNEASTTRANDMRFSNFKILFDKAVSEEAPSSTVALKSTQKDLQSITSDYPDFANVQTELAKVQNELVAALQTETDAAQSAKNKAEAQAEQSREAAQEAQSEVDSATANAQAQATQAQMMAVEQSFVNQLSTIQNNFLSDCIDNATQGERYDSAGDYSNGGIYMGSASTGCSATEKNANNLNSSFTNMPSNYTSAANAMAWAAYDLSQSIIDWLNSNSAAATTDVSNSEYYDNEVVQFLRSP